MTDTNNHAAVNGSSLEGRVFAPRSASETAEAVDLAFDYRGDVTVLLRSGGEDKQLDMKQHPMTLFISQDEPGQNTLMRITQSLQNNDSIPFYDPRCTDEQAAKFKILYPHMLKGFTFPVATV